MERVHWVEFQDVECIARSISLFMDGDIGSKAT